MKRLTGISLFVLASIAFAGRGGQIANPYRIHQVGKLKVAKISVEGHAINAWVMDDESKCSEGLMYLTDKEVKSDQGGLFLFENVQPNDKYHGFWMQNTLIPLDIIYINAAKKVINIAAGKPMDQTTLLAGAPYTYVVELKQGTAKKLGIKPGSVFTIPPGLKWVKVD